VSIGFRPLTYLIAAGYVGLAGFAVQHEWRNGDDAAQSVSLAVHEAQRAGDRDAVDRLLTRLARIDPTAAALERSLLLRAGWFGGNDDQAEAMGFLQQATEGSGPAAVKARLELARTLLAGPAADPATALRLFGDAAAAGNARAAHELGRMAELGGVVAIDLVSAESQYRKAAAHISDAAFALARLYQASRVPAPSVNAVADNLGRVQRLDGEAAAGGDIDAMMRLGRLYLAGDLMPRDPAAAKYWFEVAAAAGEIEGQVRLALMLRDGLGVARDPARAVALLTEAAERDSREALVELGNAHRDGLGVAADPARAAECYQRAAILGSSGAMFELGRAYRAGKGVPADPAKAVTWFQQAAERGHAGAQFELGRMYQAGDGVAQDQRRGFLWLLQSAQKGRLSAMSAVARAYERGIGIDANTDESIRWALRAVDAGTDSVTMLLKAANAYAVGNLVTLDVARAVELFERAAAKGETEAMLSLGKLYASLDRPDASDKAVEWFRRAEHGGQTEAMIELGRAYAAGAGVPLDERRAFEFFLRAARGGSALGMRELANALSIGFGVQQNPALAIDWYRRAADGGDSKAMLSLALSLEAGFGAAPDPKSSLAWLQRAADAGNPEAYYRLGLVYADGSLAPRNDDQAQRYLKLAAAQKVQPAIGLLIERYGIIPEVKRK
jgi:TPR repeat protein